MPSTTVSQRRHAAPTQVRNKSSITNFSFPADHHLLITTEKHICCWSEKGLEAIFKSGSAGILEAREAKDGSGNLAVADSQTVLLHELARGMDRSYRLKGTEVCTASTQKSLELHFSLPLPGPSPQNRVYKRLQSLSIHNHLDERRSSILSRRSKSPRAFLPASFSAYNTCRV